MQLHKWSSVKEGFSAYLSQPEWDWSWVVHQTFDEYKCDLYPSILGFSWREFMREIARTAQMNYGWCFAETGKLGRLHWHGIVHVKTNLLRQPLRKTIWQHMFNKFGRNRIEAYIPRTSETYWIGNHRMSNAVGRYLTKYIAKESFLDNAWWDFEGFMGGNQVDSARISRAIGLPRFRDWPDPIGSGGE